MTLELRNRIRELRQVPTAELAANPRNWREHPAQQAQALAGILREVGVADALIAYESPRAGGKLTLIDGHLRREQAPGTWPVLILDVDDAEADYLLATLDPLAGMATAAKAALDALLGTVQSSEAAVQQMLAAQATAAGLYLEQHGEQTDDPGAQIDKEERLHYQGCMAKGCFTITDTRNWSDQEHNDFMVWKESPDTSTRSTERIANEIAKAITTIFGGTIPPGVAIVIPPSGMEREAGVYPAGVLASAVGRLTGMDVIDCLARTESDPVKQRSRFTNLRDITPFTVAKRVGPLVIVLDDVITTGSTMQRSREALRANSVATICIAYVFWHGFMDGSGPEITPQRMDA